MPGALGRPDFTSWSSGVTAGATVEAVDEGADEQAASDDANSNAAATRTDGSAWRRR